MLRIIFNSILVILLFNSLSYSQSQQQILIHDTTTAPRLIDGTKNADSLIVGLFQPDSGYVQVPEPSEKAMKFYRSGNYLYMLKNHWFLA